MNAEEVEKIQSKRVCHLKVDERFMWQGICFRVNIIDETGIWYDNNTRNSKVTKKSALQRLGINNQMFVQIVKSS
jgi:hypothetical protein